MTAETGTDDTEPTTSESEVQVPAAQKPATQKSGAQKPATQKTGAKKPAPKKSTGQKPTGQKSAGQKSAGQKSAAAKSATTSATRTPSSKGTTSAKGTTAAKASAQKSATPKSATPKSTTQKAAAAKTATTAPAAKPTSAKSTAARPGTTAAKKPVAKKQATAKPTPQKPAPQKPTSQKPAPTSPAKPSTTPAATESASAKKSETVLRITGLSKHFGKTFAVNDVTLSVQSGTIFGIVGPNGAGKTTTLSMVTGLLRPDAGTITVHGADVWTDPEKAKRNMGVLPDRLRLFDRLTGNQLLHYSGVLRGLSGGTVTARAADLSVAFGLEDALDRLVADYSAGMTKKVALAAAMLHSPRLLVLDEPFESVDPVSAANIIEILHRYVAAGGTVVLSSHSMDLIQRICDSVAVIIDGRVLAAGTMREVRGTKSLEQRFVELAGGRRSAEGMEWLHSFSD